MNRESGEAKSWKSERQERGRGTREEEVKIEVRGEDRSEQ